jgi:hypothetical protein
MLERKSDVGAGSRHGRYDGSADASAASRNKTNFAAQFIVIGIVLMSLHGFIPSLLARHDVPGLRNKRSHGIELGYVELLQLHIRTAVNGAV